MQLLCLEIPKFIICYMIFVNLFTINYIKQILMHKNETKYPRGLTDQDLVYSIKTEVQNNTSIFLSNFLHFLHSFLTNFNQFIYCLFQIIPHHLLQIYKIEITYLSVILYFHILFHLSKLPH